VHQPAAPPGKFSSGPGWKISIAIATLPENLIRINQILIENFQADFDFYFSTGPWLKNFEQTLIEKWCTSAIFRRETDLCTSARVFNFWLSNPDWIFLTGPWLKNFHRDHDRDWNCDPDRSDFDWNFLPDCD